MSPPPPLPFALPARFASGARPSQDDVADAPPTERQPSFQEGRVVGSYELVARVAEGGMGYVWLARDVATGRRVVLKTIRDDLDERPGAASLRRMFLEEARLAQALVHPGLARVHEAGVHEGALFAVMEWIDGASLADLLRRRRNKTPGGAPAPTTMHRFAPDVALRLVVRVARALHAMHELRTTRGLAVELVHRDVSPQNVLLTPSGEVKLIDFGVAKARHGFAETTGSDIIKGKVRFLSPEQVKGLRLDRRSDVWALGALLRVLVTGEDLFPGRSDVEVLCALSNRQPLARPRFALPVPVAELLDVLLAFDRAARVGSAADVERLAQGALAALGARPESEGPPGPELAAFARAHAGGERRPLPEPAAVASPPPSGPDARPTQPSPLPRRVCPGAATLGRRASRSERRRRARRLVVAACLVSLTLGLAAVFLVARAATRFVVRRESAAVGLVDLTLATAASAEGAAR